MNPLILALLLCLSTAAFAQRKFALIVAVGNYMPNSNIPPIASLNDVKYIKAVLHANGFMEKDIDTLEDSRATKAAILKALDELAAKSKMGDIVVVHFSCHGQQIRDQKTVAEGKDEEDGYDEALIPYDVKKPQYFPGLYTGENHLRDDDLGPKLIAIRNALGKSGSLLVLLDACHSGTATRALEFTASRGEPIPFNDPENPLQSNVDLPTEDHFFDNLSDSASNMVMISGSGPHQQNFQTEIAVDGKKEEVGALTYAFYKAMSDLPAESDYELLFQKIKAQIQSQHPEQIPLAEGNTSQIVFSGNYKPKKETIFLTPVVDSKGSSDTLFKIDKGIMDGVSEGTSLKIYSAGNTNPIGEGIIKRSDRFSAYGISSKPLSKGSSYEARIDEFSNGSISTSIKIKDNKSPGQGSLLGKQLKLFFQPYKFITFSENADMMIDLSKTSDKGTDAYLVDAFDSTRWQKQIGVPDTLTADDKKQLMTAIKNSMRVKYLRTMRDGGELAKFVKVAVVPANAHDDKDELVLGTEENYSLKIDNTGEERMFYTVLDITPDNKVEVLYPSASKSPADYSIAKKSSVIRNLRVSKNTPIGREFLKIIVSKDPMDIRSVLQHSTQRGDMRSFQRTLDDIFNERDDERATRGDVNSIKAEEIGITTVSFSVKQK